MTRRPTADWILTTLWFSAGICATGGFWFFLGSRNDLGVAVSALATIAGVSLAIWLHVRNERLRGGAPPAREEPTAAPTPDPGWGEVPAAPPYEERAQRSRSSWLSHLHQYLDQHPGAAEELGVKASENLLAMSVDTTSFALDCVCTVLTRAGRTYLLLPSGESEPNVEGVGRSALMLRLLGVRIDYTPVLAAHGNGPPPRTRIEIQYPLRPGWQLVASDFAYMTVLEGRLSAIAIKGEPLSWLWDLARHVYRTTDIGYSTGKHRTPEGREFLLAVFNAMVFNGLTSIYATTGRPYVIDEVIIVRRSLAQASEVPALRPISAADALHKVEMAALVSSDRHGSDFWHRPSARLQGPLQRLLTRAATRLPSVSELSLPSMDGTIPMHVFEEAAALLTGGGQSTVPAKPLGEVILGIGAYNRLLFSALPAISALRMAVISGEKVFRDAAFWRALMAPGRRVNVEVLMLDPSAPAVSEIERAAYPDKQPGFLQAEILQNLEVLRHVSAEIARSRSGTSVRCWLYSVRPRLRVTIFDDARAVFAPYLTTGRTGDITPFADVYEQGAESVVAAFITEFEQWKSISATSLAP